MAKQSPTRIEDLIDALTKLRDDNGNLPIYYYVTDGRSEWPITFVLGDSVTMEPASPETSFDLEQFNKQIKDSILAEYPPRFLEVGIHYD